VRRAVHRPPGAKPLHAIPGKPNCATAGGEANLVLTQIKGPLIYAPSTPEQSLSILRTMGPFLVKPRRDAVTVRGQWLAAGYPASYPAIQDLDAIISAFDRLAVAAKAEDLNAMSKIYQDLNSASDQYAFDGDDCV
jgi:hypothetical protein